MRDQLTRIETKLDKVLVTTVENKEKLKNHIMIDKWVYRWLVVLTVVVLSVHTASAVSILKGVV